MQTKASIFDFDEAISEDSDNEDFRKRQSQGISEHCYFNRKEYEINKLGFLALKGDNIYDFLVEM